MEFFSQVWSIFVKYNPFFMEGVKNTLILSFFTVIFGAILGTLMAFARMSSIAPLRWLAVAYIEFFRGTPLMVQLFFFYYGLMPMIPLPEALFGIADFKRYAVSIFVMSLNSCAYIAEVIRSGIQSVDRGQTEAARSLGFSAGRTMTMVVLPQAIRNILPALGNEFVTVIKESSIVSVIGIADLMFRSKGVISKNYRSLETYLIAAVLYFIMTFISSRLVVLMERKMNHNVREHRRHNP